LRDYFVVDGSLPCTRVITRDTHEERATQLGYLSGWQGDRDKGIEIVYGEDELFCTGPTIEQPRQKKISCIPARQAQAKHQPRKDLFHLYSLIPHSPQFQQSAGATPL
jgi:hypothetical protein